MQKLMKLIKTQDKFILVSDEEILTDDNYVAWETSYATEPKERWVIYNRVSGLNGTNQKKIISENPDFSLLSEEDCKTIGWVDIEKLADTYLRNHNKLNRIDYGLNLQSYKDGFTTAQSLNDKMFSLEDMGKAIKCAHNSGRIVKLYAVNPDFNLTDYTKELIQSLQQTSWDVGVEMERETLYTDDGLDYKGDLRPKITNNSIKVTKIL